MDTQSLHPLVSLPMSPLGVGPQLIMEEVVWVVEGYLSP